jgi:hypothetical protein
LTLIAFALTIGPSETAFFELRRGLHSSVFALRLQGTCPHRSILRPVTQRRKLFCLRDHQRQSLFNVIDQATGWKIDLIIRKSRAYSQEELERRQRVNLHGVSLFMTTAEDAVISKLEWAKLGQSRRQIEDAAAILRARWGALDHSYLTKWIDVLDMRKEWDDARQVAGISD